MARATSTANAPVPAAASPVTVAPVAAGVTDTGFAAVHPPVVVFFTLSVPVTAPSE